ncbi:MAG: RNA 2',3'-cyclic phosphodiesterase [Clostridiales bacterium]|nr:RNA 2',3'-cyclic phosphodiesterase [Clostridiales bacterium]
MRLFAAIELNDRLRTAAAAAQGQLKAHGVTGRFPPPGNLHLTLCFFGEGEKDGLLCALMGESYTSARLTVEGCGCFMGGSLLHLKIKTDPGLMEIQRRVQDAALKLGYRLDGRPYVPHITLCRKMQAPVGVDLFACCKGAMGVSMDVERISLMESKLNQNGAVYHRVGTIAVK